MWGCVVMWEKDDPDTEEAWGLCRGSGSRHLRPGRALGVGGAEQEAGCALWRVLRARAGGLWLPLQGSGGLGPCSFAISVAGRGERGRSWVRMLLLCGSEKGSEPEFSP